MDEMDTSLFHPLSGVFDLSELAPKSTLGFTELLGIHDFSSYPPPPLVESAASQQALNPVLPRGTTQEAALKTEARSEAVNHPTTSNQYSSISSTSRENNKERPASKVEEEGEEKEEEAAEETQRKSCQKQLKSNKANKKKERMPRIAFMTKSEVDHLEDGYRWRKYGQKAVKNSPWPRNYYRCTTPSCKVKKRVERCVNDSSVVVTTYEGQHTHPSPVATRPSFTGMPPINHFGYSMKTSGPCLQRYYYDHQLSLMNNNIHGRHLSLGYGNAPSRSVFMNDNGLLQDVVPLCTFNEHS